MFNTLFSKRKVKKSKKISNPKGVEDTIDFSDLKGQNFSVYIAENGNSNMLIIQEQSGKYEILLDSEQAFLLSLVLNEYGNNKQITKAINIFKEKE